MKDTWVVNPGTVRHLSFSTSQGYLILPIKSNSLVHNTPNPSLGHSRAHSLLTTSACMHGRTSHTRTQHKQATTRVHKRLRSAHDMTQDVKGNVYIQLTWTASSRKKERVAAYGITNGGGNGAMESSKTRDGGASSLQPIVCSPQKSPLFLNLGHILAHLHFGRFTLATGALYKLEALRPRLAFGHRHMFYKG